MAEAAPLIEPPSRKDTIELEKYYPLFPFAKTADTHYGEGYPFASYDRDVTINAPGLFSSLNMTLDAHPDLSLARRYVLTPYSRQGKEDGLPIRDEDRLAARIARHERFRSGESTRNAEENPQFFQATISSEDLLASGLLLPFEEGEDVDKKRLVLPLSAPNQARVAVWREHSKELGNIKQTGLKLHF